MLVIPGGGFKFVSISNEGRPVARWLADHGVSAFVLKYRVDATPVNADEFGKAMIEAKQSPLREASTMERQFEPSAAIAREDAQTAIRMIRGNAAKWGIDTKRVGMLGFLAGAMTPLATALDDAPDARHDFIAPIYGMIVAMTPPTNPQPMFTAIASDVPMFSTHGFGNVESWQIAGGSVELHNFEGGGQGFGAQKRGSTSDLWFDQFMA